MGADRPQTQTVDLPMTIELILTTETDCENLQEVRKFQSLKPKSTQGMGAAHQKNKNERFSPGQTAAKDGVLEKEKEKR